jgi:hypothetical protein
MILNDFLQEIVAFARTKNITIDNSKRASIETNLQRLRAKIRGEEVIDYEPIFREKAVLPNLAESEAAFIFHVPMNSHYMVFLEAFFSSFLRTEHLEFRPDFMDVWRKLASDLLAFRTFTWSLDWITGILSFHIFRYVFINLAKLCIPPKPAGLEPPQFFVAGPLGIMFFTRERSSKGLLFTLLFFFLLLFFLLFLLLG